MHMVVNTSPSPVYKKYRITSLLCIFETIIVKHNSLRTSQIKCHDFICEDTFSRHPGSCSLYSIVTSASRVQFAVQLSGIYTLTCQKIVGNPYQCNSSYIRPYISVSNTPGEKQKFIPYLTIVLISLLQQPRES